jgi:hypothetical protein
MAEMLSIDVSAFFQEEVRQAKNVFTASDSIDIRFCELAENIYQG